MLGSVLHAGRVRRGNVEVHLRANRPPSSTEAAYAYLGEVRLKSWQGDRPIAITWELQVPMSAALFARFGTLRVG